MRHSTDLLRLERTMLRRLEKIRGWVDDAQGRRISHAESCALICVACLELVNTWGNFSRSYYLSCVIGARRRNRFRVLVRFVGTPAAAIDAAAVHVKPHLAGGPIRRRDEPAWHDATIFRRCCTFIGCSNSAQIDAAFGLGSTFFQHGVVFRNFFGHRNQGTISSARKIATKYAIPAGLHPREILLSRPLGRPRPLLYDWIDEVVATVGLLCD